MSGDSTPSRPGRRFLISAVVLAGAVGLVVGGFVLMGQDDTPTRQEIVARRGAAVMPFDLDATRHEFVSTATGAVETVTANSPADVTQIDLIRRHLRREATRFEHGDFGDPAAIHGHDMPGLQTLERSAGRITVAYAERPAGATIIFNTTEPALRAALADWVMAQNMDHGSSTGHG